MKLRSEVIDPYNENNVKREVFNQSMGIILNGEDNLRPIVIENMYASSPTASQAAWIYGSFLVGGGFEQDLTQVNLADKLWYFQNPNHLLYSLEDSLSKHQGVFIHIGYNANYEKTSYKVVPYTLCRLGKADSEDYSGKVVVSSEGWSKFFKPKDDCIKVYDAYNPNPKIMDEQVERDGGWDNYKGQILYFKFSDKYHYSVSMLENAYLFADVEHHLGKYYSSTVKRNFENTQIIRHKPFESKDDFTNFHNNIKKISGIDNASSKLVIEDEWDDVDQHGSMKIDEIKSDVKSDKYKHFEISSSNFIRKAHKNIPPQLMDYVAGKLGNTSGEDLIKAQAIYNASISRDQEMLELLFKELFKKYKDDINPSENWKIKQYKLLDDGTVNT
jgi:hypothetical protein